MLILRPYTLFRADMIMITGVNLKKIGTQAAVICLSSFSLHPIWERKSSETIVRIFHLPVLEPGRIRI
jgi:hypothetical protein